MTLLHQPKTRSVCAGKSALGFHDFTATQAGRADADALSLAIYLGVHRTQVNIPAPFGDVVGMADAVSRLRLLAADFTLLCHSTAPRKFRSCRANLDFTGCCANSATATRSPTEWQRVPGRFFCCAILILCSLRFKPLLPPPIPSPLRCISLPGRGWTLHGRTGMYRTMVLYSFAMHVLVQCARRSGAKLGAIRAIQRLQHPELC